MGENWQISIFILERIATIHEIFCLLGYKGSMEFKSSLKCLETDITYLVVVEVR